MLVSQSMHILHNSSVMRTPMPVQSCNKNCCIFSILHLLCQDITCSLESCFLQFCVHLLRDYTSFDIHSFIPLIVRPYLPSMNMTKKIGNALAKISFSFYLDSRCAKTHSHSVQKMSLCDDLVALLFVNLFEARSPSS